MLPMHILYDNRVVKSILFLIIIELLQLDVKLLKFVEAVHFLVLMLGSDIFKLPQLEQTGLLYSIASHV